MAMKITAERTTLRNLEGYPIRYTEKFHEKTTSGKRTIRVEYMTNMPHRHGSWYKGTVTERVVEGEGGSLKVLIPEHRVA
jgi:hypothetical protein